VSEPVFNKRNATLQLILDDLKELRKHIRDVGAGVKTERSVIHDEIKTEECVLSNGAEDKFQKSMSAVDVGQEKLDYRSLNQGLSLQAAIGAVGPPAKLQEVTGVRQGK
jgi:hypothetical protein